MTIKDINVIKRIVRDGIGLNQATLANMVPDLVSEIERLQKEVEDRGYACEAAGDGRFVK